MLQVLLGEQTGIYETELHQTNVKKSASEANFKRGGSVGMSITLLSCLLTRPRLIKLQNHFIGKTTNQNNVTKQNFYNIIINMTTKREITLDDQ